MSLKRRDFITLLGGAAAWPVAARAQQPMRRIGALLDFSPDDPEGQARNAAFLQTLGGLGWTVGRNLTTEYRWTKGDLQQMRKSSAEVVALAPDVIIANGTPMTDSVRRLTSTIPIVFINVADPLVSGIVANFAHPGGNVTGFSSVQASFAGKWLSLLKDMAPSITRVMFLYSVENSNWSGYLRAIEAAAPSAGVAVSATVVASSGEVSSAIETFAREPNSGMIVQPTTLTNDLRETIAALAMQHRLPAMYPYSYFAESGGLASYGSDPLDLYRRAAVYADRILRGEKPGDLPVQAPTKFEFVINLKVAKAIGLDVPYSVLILADKLIE
jgi:putative ABC transport system substrate-binding protein